MSVQAEAKRGVLFDFSEDMVEEVENTRLHLLDSIPIHILPNHYVYIAIDREPTLLRGLVIPFII